MDPQPGRSISHEGPISMVVTLYNFDFVLPVPFTDEIVTLTNDVAEPTRPECCHSAKVSGRQTSITIAWQKEEDIWPLPQ